METIFFCACFAIIAIASKEIGQSLLKKGLPLISGFLFTGIIAGPYVLNLISYEATLNLQFIDELSLGFIAYAASNELHLKEIKQKLKSIAWITTGIIVSTFFLCTVSVYMLSNWIPFMKQMPASNRWAVSILAGAIMVARSPSSAIAIINELRAKGTYTSTILSVTVIMDVLVIIIFSTSSSIAGAILSGLPFNIGFIGLLICELSVSFFLGYLLNKLLILLLRSSIRVQIKKWAVLLSGYMVFVCSKEIKLLSHQYLPFEILLEPLLICMIAGFYVSNFSRYRHEFSQLLNDISAPIYIVFFTMTGASMSLDILAKTWHIAFALFFVRCVALSIGSYIGGMLARHSNEMNRIAWMGYVTQAGVALGLAREVIVEFPAFGSSFATIIVSIVVLNQIFGPPLFKRAIKKMNEDRTRATHVAFEGIRDAFIFGTDGQSFALAHSLISHGWQVNVACARAYAQEIETPQMKVIHFSHISLSEMQHIQLEKAGAIVAMMSDEENYQICELAYEHFGTETLIARLNNRNNYPKFQALDVLIVDPGTAIVNLLDHFVRSPSGASLLMGMQTNQRIIDIHVRNPELFGVAIRDLTIPFDTIIMSIRRRGQIIIPHGYTALEAFDLVTVVGSSKNIKQLAFQFDSHPEYAMVNFVEKARARQLSVPTCENEVRKIIQKANIFTEDRFERIISKSQVLDIHERIHATNFFEKVAQAMSGDLNISSSVLYDLLMQREQEVSTVLTPGLALPHIIIQGEHLFSILIARCKKGIIFSESRRVYAAFVLVGTRDERDFHLQALSSIAKIVLLPNFEKRWNRARNENALRNVLIQANRSGHTMTNGLTS
jgi:Trk K+ transport system NAD-binding subunit/Kef-type K+ transport system membrane component KefB/mannitol/fructose-specific phosphotransferase system IIA component (Ntr-type)